MTEQWLWTAQCQLIGLLSTPGLKRKYIRTPHAKVEQEKVRLIPHVQKITLEREVRNCKVAHGECVTAQHRVLVMDLEIRSTVKGRPAPAPPTIKWRKLTHQEEV